ncbi:MAG: hypothetical protein ACLQFW_19540 [Xanthobacteraceae bacterium]
MQSRGIHRDEAIAGIRAMAMRDADAEKSVAGNVERFAGPLNRDRGFATFAPHQRAEAVMPDGARAGPRCRTRQPAIYMSVTAGATRVDVARAYSAERVSYTRRRRRRWHRRRIGRGCQNERERDREQGVKHVGVQATQNMPVLSGTFVRFRPVRFGSV